MYNIKNKIFLLLIFFIFLTGCREKNNNQDIKDFVAATEHQIPKPMKALPKFLDEFKNHENEITVKEHSNKNNLNCVLSNFKVSALDVVADFSNSITKWALIAAPDTSVTKIQLGDRIGSECLIVSKINDLQLDLIKSENAYDYNKNFIYPQHSNISLNFKNLSIETALYWLAKFVNINVVVDAAVKGNITLQLKNISFEQAINIILQLQRLSQRKIENIIYIAPIDEITKIEKTEQEALDRAPLHILLFQLKYAKAADIVKLLKNNDQSLMTSRGRATIDERTNSILIRDSQSQLNEIQEFIKKIDVPVPQILIEARIVSIDDDYERNLGIKFGLTNGSHLSGTLKGANSLASGTPASNVKIEDRLNVDLPATANNAAHIGLALFKLADGTLLDLELSALESEGHAEILSNPHLITANQHPAIIESGEEIPYEEAVAQGVTTTSFKKAVLSLQVTPQITKDNKIILGLKVNQDKRSSKEVKGVPAIDTRQITTQVLVNDGQTVVLGGVYENTKTRGVERVPFLSDIPVVGLLFRHNKITNSRRESLIFVTPKIIKNNSVTE